MMKYFNDFAASFSLGTTQVAHNMAVVPLFHPQTHDFTYLCLKDSLDKNLLEIKEVDQHGTVPTLIAINKGSAPILILDGEELAGGKQNRVLNTTILLKGKSQTTIPVSCTESGRWHFISPKFADSGVTMMATIRGRKARAVSANLQSKGRYESNQGEIWESIDELSRQAAVNSPSSAMKDVIEQKRIHLKEYLEAFSWEKNQKGLLVIINDQVVGFDYISSEKVLKKLYTKLIESYALEAYFHPVRSKRKAKDKASSKEASPKKESPKEKSAKEDTYHHQAAEFLNLVKNTPSRRFPSPGQGWDYRFQQDNLVGSALYWRKKIIHAAFFHLPSQRSTSPLAGPRERSRYRL